MSCNTFAQCYSTVVYAYDNIIARRTDGTLWARGRNSYGNGGNGTTGFLAQFVQVGTDNNWTDAISADINNVYAIRTDGTLWVWGACYNTRYLGLGNLGDLGIIPPTQIGTATNWKAVSGSFAIKTDGTLWSWGLNFDGRLGIGNTDDTYIASTPTQMGTDSDWNTLDSGYINVAIKNNGTLWSWGSATYNLGYPNANVNDAYASPHQVGTDTDWVMATISGNSGFTACIKTNGTLWAWGKTTPFQSAYLFGNGIESYTADAPIQIGTDTNWKMISAAVRNIIGLKTNGTRWGWGENNFYQLGMGQGMNSFVTIPTQLDSATDWKYVTNDNIGETSGSNIGIKQNNSLYYWGSLHPGGIANRVYIPTLMGTECTLATTSFSTNAVMVYPNPATTSITIALEKSNNNNVTEMTITNMLGQNVFTVKNPLFEVNNQYTIDIKALQTGLYLLNINNKNKIVQTKFIKN